MAQSAVLRVMGGTALTIRIDVRASEQCAVEGAAASRRKKATDSPGITSAHG